LKGTTVKLKIALLIACALPAFSHAQGTQTITKDQVTALLAKFNCKVSAPGVNGGAGENCLNGQALAVVVTPKAILIETSTNQSDAAYTSIKGMFPNAARAGSKITVALE
jgi:hypothetical protein